MRDWLICRQVALDKRSISHRATMNNCCQPRTYINKMAALSLQVYITFFKFIPRLLNLKEAINTQQETGNIVETLSASF